MDFFDNLINEFNEMISLYSKREYSFDANNSWQDVGQNELVMQRESAYELDGIGFNLVTSKPVENGVTVIGDDLSSIASNRKFARITVLSLDDADDEQRIYDLIRKIEYVKYHFFPKGYMIRTSSRGHKEVVRVSKASVNSGISFEKIGNLLLSKFFENQNVKSAHTYFISEKNFDYNKLENIAKKNHRVTETLNHIMNNVNFDCNSCNLKPICDEVEGMRELHFKQKRM